MTNFKISNEEVIEKAKRLTESLGRRFSSKEWSEYAKNNNLPQSFSKNRRKHLHGSITGLAEFCAKLLKVNNQNARTNIIEKCMKLAEKGYTSRIKDGRIFIEKVCKYQKCNTKFEVSIKSKDSDFCSTSCSANFQFSDPKSKSRLSVLIKEKHKNRKSEVKAQQIKVFKSLKDKKGRDPTRSEWKLECKKLGVSSEISRKSSPFRYFKDLVKVSNT